jgi:hypothetical protein
MNSAKCHVFNGQAYRDARVKTAQRRDHRLQLIQPLVTAAHQR